MSELMALLEADSTVSAPVEFMPSSGKFKRVITSPSVVGNVAVKWGGAATNVIAIIADRLGNLETAFPGTLH
jgi:hypothetical protein